MRAALFAVISRHGPSAGQEPYAARLGPGADEYRVRAVYLSDRDHAADQSGHGLLRARLVQHQHAIGCTQVLQPALSLSKSRHRPADRRAPRPRSSAPGRGTPGCRLASHRPPPQPAASRSCAPKVPAGPAARPALVAGARSDRSARRFAPPPAHRSHYNVIPAPIGMQTPRRSTPRRGRRRPKVCFRAVRRTSGTADLGAKLIAQPSHGWAARAIRSPFARPDSVRPRCRRRGSARCSRSWCGRAGSARRAGCRSACR